MPTQFFVNIRISIPEEYYDLSYAVFNDYPIQGIEERIDEMIVCFKESDWTPELETDMTESLKSLIPQSHIVSMERIEQRNWNEAWEQSLEPIYINDRIAISPSWHAKDVHHELTIIIDPKMSFGTGYHPTTRMTTRLVEEYTTPKSHWIDAGTGTGVLAIVAAKLGAAHVFAFDNDEWSIENAQENVRLNGVADRVQVESADVFTIHLTAVDGIVANMYRNVLIPVFPKLYSALKNAGDPLIISGILQYDEDEIIQAATASGFQHIKTLHENEWLAMVFKRN